MPRSSMAREFGARQEDFEITKQEKIKLGEKSSRKMLCETLRAQEDSALSQTRGREGSTMESKHIANGFMDVWGDWNPS